MTVSLTIVGRHHNVDEWIDAGGDVDKKIGKDVKGVILSTSIANLRDGDRQIANNKSAKNY